MATVTIKEYSLLHNFIKAVHARVQLKQVLS